MFKSGCDLEHTLAASGVINTVGNGSSWNLNGLFNPADQTSA